MSETLIETPAAIEAEAAPAPVVDAAPDATILGAADASGAAGDDAAAEPKPDADGDGDAGEAGADPVDQAAADLEKPYEGLNAPEGFTLDDDTMALAAPLMREFGVTDDKAQAFIDKAAPIMARAGETAVASYLQAQTDAVAERAAAWANETRADPEIGGAKFDETVAMAAKARDTLFSPEFRTFLNESKLGNHPEMLRGLAKAGRALSDDTVITPQIAGRTTPKSEGEALYGDMKPVPSS